MTTEEAKKQMIEAIRDGAIGSGPKGVVSTTLDKAVPSDIYEMIMRDELERQAHWICCPWCDRDTCDRNADDCDVKKWIEKKEAERCGNEE